MAETQLKSQKQYWQVFGDAKLLLNEIKRLWKEGYFVRDLAYDYEDENFSLIMEVPANGASPKQFLHMCTYAEDLHEYADREGEFILNIIHSDFEYIVISQETRQKPKQIIEPVEEIDLDFIQDFAKKNFFAQDLAIQVLLNVVLFTEHKKTDFKIDMDVSMNPVQLNNRLEREQLALHSAIFDEDDWFFTFMPLKDFSRQQIIIEAGNMHAEIKTMRDNGMELLSTRASDDGWVFIFVDYCSKKKTSLKHSFTDKWRSLKFFPSKKKKDITPAPSVETIPETKQQMPSSPQDDRPKFSIRHLKTYIDDEVLADDVRKYRTVFCTNEIKDVFVELSIMNKMHGEENWEASILFELFDVTDDNKSSIARIRHSENVSHEHMVHYFRVHVGRERQGTYLPQGNYRWEASIEGNDAEEIDFYVIEPHSNQTDWFTFDSIRLFEDKTDMGNGTQRVYYRKFHAEKTRAIGIEILGYSLALKKWQMEMFAHFRDSEGNLKETGLMDIEVDPFAVDDHMFGVQCCAGKDEPGFWKKGFYSIDLVFMGKKMASLVFEVADEFEEGGFDLERVIIKKNEKLDIAEQIKAAQGEDNLLAESIGALDKLVGLNALKKAMHAHIDYVNFISKRGEKGLASSSFPLHMIFTGSPGTGKTTVAMMLGKIYKAMGILSKGHMVVEERSTLIGKYYGSCEINTKAAIEKAEGGILFIDEAYNLFRKDDPKDPGKDILDTLLTRLSSDDQDIIVVLAGYTQEMLELLDYNPGIRSRFPNHFHFNDFSADELLEIAHQQAKEKSLIFDEEVDANLKLLFEESRKNADKSFGNGRFVQNIISRIMIHMGTRLAKHENYDELSEKALSEVLSEDIPYFEEIKKLSTAHLIDEDMYADQLGKINQLIGLVTVKNEISDFARLIRYYSETGRNIKTQINWISLFLGRSGLGITTMANYFAGLLKSLRIIKRKHVTELHQEIDDFDFLLSNIPVFTRILEEASGGVLLIDFGKQIGDQDLINRMLTRIFDLTKYGGNRVYVIIYGEAQQPESEVDRITDPGIEFDLNLFFGDYSLEELWQIFSLKINEHNLSLDQNAREIVWEHINRLINDNYLLSPRIMKKLADMIAREQHLRMAHTNAELRRGELLKTVTADDVAGLIPLRNILPDSRNYR